MSFQMQPLLDEVRSEAKQILAQLFGRLILFIPIPIFFAGLTITGQIVPDAPFQMQEVDFAFMEESPEFRQYLLDSLPYFLPLCLLFIVSYLAQVCFIFPWLLRTERGDDSETLWVARSLLIREGGDSVQSLVNASLRSRLESSLRLLQPEEPQPRPSPLTKIFPVFFLTWLLAGPVDGSLQIHEVAAQLIPVWVIALAFDTRRLSPKEITWSEKLMMSFAFLALAIGEAAALTSLLNGEPRFGDLALAAIAAGFAAVAAAAFDRH
jgi:hypothetical protein